MISSSKDCQPSPTKITLVSLLCYLALTEFHGSVISFFFDLAFSLQNLEQVL
jgi:hypothetical protein